MMVMRLFGLQTDRYERCKNNRVDDGRVSYDNSNSDSINDGRVCGNT